MCNQGIDQCPGPVARAGMYNQASRLIDNDNLIVFMHDVQRNVFCKGFGVFRLGQNDGNNRSGFDLE